MKSFLISSLLTLFLFTTAIQAAPNGTNKGLSEQQAVEISQQAYPGRVLNVKRKGKMFKVKTLNDKGEVRVIKIDANNGKVISGH